MENKIEHQHNMFIELYPVDNDGKPILYRKLLIKDVTMEDGNIHIDTLEKERPEIIEDVNFCLQHGIEWDTKQRYYEIKKQLSEV